MTEWKPIETAPRDERILLWQSWPCGFVWPAKWIGEPHNFWRKDSGGDVCKPTHWMPLPEPPRAD